MKEEASMKLHVLKCWPEFFRATLAGDKPFEVRENDRNYQVSDWLLLREWEPGAEEYADRAILAKVTYVLDDPRFVLPGYVVMGIRWEWEIEGYKP